MSDPQRKAAPDVDLLEFLGDIDEANDDSRDADFADFLANTDIGKIAGRKPGPKPPLKEKSSE